MRYYLVLTTVGNAAQAETLARGLVESRLAACVNIQSGLRSVYRWEGRIQDESEILLLIKTREDRVDALEARIHSEHPYDVPEFLVVPVDRGSPGYLAWVDGCLVPDQAAASAPAVASEPTEGTLQVSLEILEVLDAYGQPHETVGNPVPFAVLFRDGGVSHACWMAKETLDTSETLREREDLE